MPLVRNIIRGKKAKHNGSAFENLILASCERSGIVVTQIPSGCRWVSGQRAIPVKTDFDFIIWYNGQAIAFDAKTTNAKNFGASSIEFHQVKKLHKIMQMTGNLTGYLVYFQTDNKVIFFDALKLNETKKGSSLKVDDGLLLGELSKMDLKGLFHGKLEQ
jgi:recombination protein U